ncbi:MAG: hypothetical protein Q8Q95_00085 [bacterium]|nr:hypothetical protein [bacterium]
MLWCWLFGHKLTGDMFKGAFTNASGEIKDGWRSFCACCPITREYPDPRNLWKRHITIWLSRRRNLRAFAKLHEEFRKKDPDGSKYLAQLSSYSYGNYSKTT